MRRWRPTTPRRRRGRRTSSSAPAVLTGIQPANGRKQPTEAAPVFAKFAFANSLRNQRKTRSPRRRAWQTQARLESPAIPERTSGGVPSARVDLHPQNPSPRAPPNSHSGQRARVAHQLRAVCLDVGTELRLQLLLQQEERPPRFVAIQVIQAREGRVEREPGAPGTFRFESELGARACCHRHAPADQRREARRPHGIEGRDRSSDEVPGALEQQAREAVVVDLVLGPEGVPERPRGGRQGRERRAVSAQVAELGRGMPVDPELEVEDV